MFPTPFTAIVVIGKILRKIVDASARWWPCGSQNFFLVVRRLEKIDIFERHTCLSPGAQILIGQKEENWLQLLFYFLVLMSIVTSFTAMSILTVSVSSLKFSRNAPLRKLFAIGFRTWFDLKWIEFGVLCLIKDFFVDLIYVSTETCKNRSNMFLFWQHQVFPISSFRVFWSVL